MDSRFFRGNNRDGGGGGGEGKGLRTPPPPLSSLQHSSATIYHNNHCHSHQIHLPPPHPPPPPHPQQQQQQQRFLLPPPPALHHRLSASSSLHPPSLDDGSSRRWSAPMHPSPSSAGALDHNDYASAILAYRQRVNNLHHPSSSAINPPHPFARPNQSPWPDRPSSASAPHHGLAPPVSRFAISSEARKADRDDDDYRKDASASFRYPNLSNPRSPEEASALRIHIAAGRRILSSSSPASVGRDHYHHCRELSNDREDRQSLSGLDSSRQSAAISAKIFLDERRSSSFRTSIQMREGSGSESYEPADLNRRGYGELTSNEVRLSYPPSVVARNSPQAIASLDRRAGCRKRVRENEGKGTFERGKQKVYTPRKRRFSCDPGLAVLPRTPESSRNLPIVRRILSSGRLAQGIDARPDEYLPRSPASFYGASPSKSIKKKRLWQKKSVSSEEGNLPILSALVNTGKPRGEEPAKKKPTLVAKDSPQKSFQTPSYNEAKTWSPVIESDYDRLLMENDCDTPLVKNIPDTGLASSVQEATCDGNSALSSKDEQDSGNWSPKGSPIRCSKSAGKALRIVGASPRAKRVKSQVVRLITSDVRLCTENRQEEQVQEASKVIKKLQDSGTNPAVSPTPVPTINSLGQDMNGLAVKIKDKQHLVKDPCQEKGRMGTAIVESPELVGLPGADISTPSSQRRPILQSDPIDNIVVRQSASHHFVCNEREEYLYNLESPLNAMNMPPLKLSLSSETSGDIQISGTTTSQTEIPPHQKPSLFLELQVDNVTKSLERTNTDNLRDLLSVHSSNGINLLQLKSTNLNSEGAVFSPAFVDRAVTPISTLGKDQTNDSESQNLKNKEILEEVEIIGLNQQKIDWKAEQEVRIFGKSLKKSTVNAKPMVCSTQMITGSSVENVCISDSNSEKMVNPGCAILGDYAVKDELFMQQAGTSSSENTSNSAVDSIYEKQDGRGGALRTMMVTPLTVCAEGVMAEPLSSTETSDFAHERPLDGLPDKSMEERTDVSSHAFSSPVINLTTKMEGSTMVTSSGVREKICDDDPVNVDCKNVLMTSRQDFKLDEVITKTNITTMYSTSQDFQSEEIIRTSNKSTEAATGIIINVTEQGSLSNLRVKEANVGVEIASPVPRTLKEGISLLEANSGMPEANLQEKPEANTLENLGNNFVEKLTGHPTSKKLSGPIMQPHGRMQNRPTRAGARTWYRSTNSVVHSISKTSKQVSTTTGPLPTSTQKVADVASAYVRKGNSLVRASSAAGLMVPLTGKVVAGKVFPNIRKQPHPYSVFRNTMKHVKPAFRQVYIAKNVPISNSNLSLGSIEKNLAVATPVDDPEDSQRVGPLCSSEKLMDFGTSESCPNSSVFGNGKLVDDQESKRLSTSESNNRMHDGKLQPKIVPLNAQSAADSKKSGTPSTYYVKNKANQLVASTPLISSVMAGTTQDVYYKRKNNQLVRNDGAAHDKILQGQAAKNQEYLMRHSTARKALRKQACLPHSSVWTRKSGGQPASSVLPLLFPWKRQVLGHPVRAGRRKAIFKTKKGSLLFVISKKLQHLRKVQPVYSRSARGFSLHRSGLLGLSGANLKWSKSIERRSKQASEEATKAVAAVEKQRREKKEAEPGGVKIVAKSNARKRELRQSPYRRHKIAMVGLVRYKMDPSGRTLQRLPDRWSGGSAEASLQKKPCSAILPTPSRVSFDGSQYVRVGNGNQLVRDPKAVTRALANEKVRWSLHTARFRRAKRQQYCLFFTRFGKCNKKEGDCPYIHDPEKVAVCTKFLKGTCSGVNCLFSHKVIPERMPDCSYFLEGMCTNEKCPYRHVYVNPKAPICEGFLKGFCPDGDECNKKHTIICPSFAATGECDNKATCKLHHPKKSGKRVASSDISKLKSKKRRYFVAGNDGLHGVKEASDVQESGDAYDSVCNENLDFIKVPDAAVEFDEAADFQRKFACIKEHHPFLQEGFPKNIDMWITPVLLLGKPIST